ncbi:hypothetical protein B296_00020521 [Ensete ventricosum]|uniref:Uncharacterized protein n=1 Tax=Ensete ventricosum TaxID=4639 RepID=A0A426YJI6_ENSVE|nr:hypothetical protein B296_00020521 [Ensete ventricosum]
MRGMGVNLQKAGRERERGGRHGGKLEVATVVAWPLKPLKALQWPQRELSMAAALDPALLVPPQICSDQRLTAMLPMRNPKDGSCSAALDLPGDDGDGTPVGTEEEDEEEEEEGAPNEGVGAACKMRRMH